jgi:5-methylthioadenosine/S-adenosylhomocysteine deaminase
MTGPRAIRARYILTPEGLLEGAVLAIEDGLISSVGADVPDEAALDDWGEVVLIPGTVNAHGHAFQNLFKGFADDRSFESWRDDILYPFSESLDADAIYTGALFAFAEALRAGVTTTTDFFYLHDDGNDNAEAVIRAASDAGIRLVFARAFYDLDAPTQAPKRYREDARDATTRTLALAARHADDPMVSVQPAPHSLHAASPATIAAAREVAEELATPWHLHLAEASYEIDLVQERFGATPVRLLAREGLLDDRLVAIHAVWLDDEELDLLAAAGAGVVHCPGANAFLGDGIARLDELIARGVRVALGPDGGCANNRQSVFDEMRLASLLVKARRNDGGAFDASRAFALGTTGGADLLGLPVGTLAPGHHADVVALDLEDLSLHPLPTLERQLVNSMQPMAIAKVMVGGEVVAERAKPTRIDLDDLRSRIGEISATFRG